MDNLRNIIKNNIVKILNERKDGFQKEYPGRKFILSNLRNNITSRVSYPVLGAYIVGSEAKGTASEDSDLDIAIIIPKSERITSLKRTENYQSKFSSEDEKPKWRGRIIDFQFFYFDDPELKEYSKIKLF